MGAARNTGASLNDIKFGDAGGSSTSSTVWLDNIVAGATSYPGPAAVPGSDENLAPVIYGRGAC